MTQPIQVSAGHLLRPQPGDLLVFTTERYMRREDAERFAAFMQARLPGVKAIMLDGGVQLAEIHTSEEIQRLKGELLEFAQEVRRSGDTRLASMAIALIAKVTGAVA